MKTRAQSLKPAIRLGKAGVSPEFLKSLLEMMERQDMIKVRFEAFKEERKSIGREIAAKTGLTLVSLIGHTAVYFKPKAATVVDTPVDDEPAATVEAED